ncbi:MAG: bifunctional tRNA (adenosine(37)-C2)-methyltransferase TrmG/ribosomal RNA large subunit methyltransferase RlmN, partial [Gemmatimonadaceae bacterium]|nr:bifunctional tRNA (adenosine(37)-C2)-methyltransferase TrmG/ribosomal RNA large subunit methyltransferase RlmN [Gemmatimonadaceae bacterium]
MMREPRESRSEERVNLLDMLPAEAEATLRAFATANGERPFRAAQVVQHLWSSPRASLDDMTGLPSAFRERLAEVFEIPRLALSTRQRSVDGTEKFLFRLADGEHIETVAIPDGSRLTLCISSQAGCALQCSFCATGAMGFARNLRLFEIAGQVRETILLTGQKPTNIVFMGMGEPLMNWKAVDPTLTILNDPSGFGIGSR